MAAGSNPFNIDFTLVLFNVWFAFVILFRDSFDSPHPQGSWSLDRICLAMVPWFGGHPSFPTPPAITMPAMLFEPSPCPVFNHALLLVWPVTGFGVPTLLKIIHFSPLQIALSCYGRISSLPFFRHSLRPEEQCVSRPQPDGWIVFNLPAMLALCAPCVHALWTLWGLRLLGQYRNRVRYIVSQEEGESYDFSRLAHLWQTHRRQPLRKDQLITYF